MERFIPAKKFQPRKEVVEDDFFSAVVIDEAGQVIFWPLLGFFIFDDIYTDLLDPLVTQLAWDLEIFPVYR